MIGSIDELNSLGVLVGQAQDTYKNSTASQLSAKTYVIRGEFEFFASSACVFHKGALVSPPNFDNLHAVAHAKSLSLMQEKAASLSVKCLPDVPLCLLTASWSEGNVYHCYIDTVGKLSVLSKFADIRNFTYLIPESSPITKEIFDMLGLMTLVYDSKLSRYAASDLTLVSLPGVTARPSYETIKYISSLMDVLPEGAVKKNIYVKRAKRGISNENEFLDRVAKFIDFEVVSLENLTLADQIKTIRDSQLVFGPHGAGFAHTVFKKSGALLEVFGPDYANPPFKNMHLETDVDYLSYFPSDNLPMKYGAAVNQNILPNFHVDLDRFEPFFQTLFRFWSDNR